MTRDVLADRVINYCDALAAFSVLNAFAFLVTLAEPDIRCSIARIAAFVIAANLTIPLIITGGLVLLRRFESSLRAPDSQDRTVERFWSYVQAFRIGLVWVGGIVVSLGVWAAAQDPTCARLAG